jgi:aminopeptidase N
MLATNEALYAWMDEGFTSYAQNIVLDSLYHRNRKNMHQRSYNGYFSLVKSGLQEPLTTHADHFNTNRAYGTAAYSMGNVFMHQLGYVIGEEQLQRTIKSYFKEWQFKHPTPSDFKKIAERFSGMELDWYFDYWMNTTKTIDYGIKSVISEGTTTALTLERIGKMPMPVDVHVKLKDGAEHIYYIPLQMQFGYKKEAAGAKHEAEWPWTYLEYELNLDFPFSTIEKIEIDPSLRMADVERNNNIFPADKQLTRKQKRKRKKK